MATYALGLTPLLNKLFEHNTKPNMVAFADDLTGAGTLKQLKIWLFFSTCKILEHIEEANQIFENTNIKITSAGKRHL